MIAVPFKFMEPLFVRKRAHGCPPFLKFTKSHVQQTTNRLTEPFRIPNVQDICSQTQPITLNHLSVISGSITMVWCMPMGVWFFFFVGVSSCVRRLFMRPYLSFCSRCTNFNFPRSPVLYFPTSPWHSTATSPLLLTLTETHVH